MTTSQTAREGKAIFGQAVFGMVGVVMKSNAKKKRVRNFTVYHTFNSLVEEE